MGYVDIHSHILPNMDDGAQEMGETLKMLQIAWQEGITHIIATPHYKAGRFPADAERMNRTVDKVRREIKKMDIPITLYAGNEIYYHSELEEKFHAGALKTLNGTESVLIEFSPFEGYTYIRNAMEDILGMGYIPILAHVERYECLYKDKICVEELKAMGCGIQVNAGSVTGDAGWKTKNFIHKLLKAELVDFIGTDAHNTSGRKPAMLKCAAHLYKKYESSYVDAILCGNAMSRLLDGSLEIKKKAGE